MKTPIIIICVCVVALFAWNVAYYFANKDRRK